MQQLFPLANRRRASSQGRRRGAGSRLKQGAKVLANAGVVGDTGQLGVVSGEKEPSMLSPWAQEAKEHLQKHRPKMYRQMQKAGTLDSQVEKMANNAREEFHLAANNGMDPFEAESEAR